MTFTLTSPTLTDNATYRSRTFTPTLADKTTRPNCIGRTRPRAPRASPFPATIRTRRPAPASGTDIINLPGDARSLGENAAASGLPAGARHARNDYGDYNYGGACPPPGHGTHRYIFTIHALDCEHLDLPEDTTTARVGFNVWVHSLGSASLTGTFSR